jgi:AcrR family transcriptional regulator
MAAKRLTRAEQKERTRSRLVSAASRVIARRGLGRSSVEEISESAGFSSGAFYANFGSKDEVFAQALEMHVAEFADFLEREGAEGSAEERLSAHPKWIGQVDDWRILFWLEIVAQGGRSRKLKPVVVDYLEAARRHFEEELQRGAEESGRPLPAPPRDLATLLYAAEIGLLVQALYDRDVEGERLFGELTERLLAPREPSV